MPRCRTAWSRRRVRRVDSSASAQGQQVEYRGDWGRGRRLRLSAVACPPGGSRFASTSGGCRGPVRHFQHEHLEKTCDTADRRDASGKRRTSTPPALVCCSLPRSGPAHAASTCAILRHPRAVVRAGHLQHECRLRSHDASAALLDGAYHWMSRLAAMLSPRRAVTRAVCLCGPRSAGLLLPRVPVSLRVPLRAADRSLLRLTECVSRKGVPLPIGLRT